MKYNPDYSSRFRILKGGKISLVVSALLGGVTISFAAPTGGVVTSGVANISQSGSVTNITQSTSKAAINWQKFSVGAHETVNFKQPDVNSITLNRVIGNERSVINGALNANGQVWLLNSNGVLFGKGARINTAGLLATTKNITDADFMAGKYNFKGDSTASVINLGEIDISNSGYATLLANSVTNEGSIRAIRGRVDLVGANEVTINLNGNSIVDLRVDKGVLDALVENKGAVYADGGEIYLTTNAVNELLKGVVNNTGIIEANSLDGITGHVELFAHGGEANIAGTITALDGFVETSGDRVKIDDSFRVVADKWLIDPIDFTIAATGGDMTGATISTNLATTDVTIMSSDGAIEGDGNIYVNDEISWSSDKIFSLVALNDIFINKDITATNGSLGLYYGGGASAVGNTSDYHVNAKINLSAGQNFTTSVGNDVFLGINNDYVTMWTVVTDATAMQAMTLNDPTKNYALGTDLTLSGENNWTPIGNYDNRFKGKFDGLGHTVSNVNMEVSANHSGFFGAISEQSSIRNISLENINYTSDGNTYFGIGGLVGTSSGDISNVSVSGTMTIPESNKAGGIVGQNSGNIKNTYSNVNIVSDSLTGGIVGIQFSGGVENSYALGDITSNYAGGLIGSMSSGTTLKNSYASNTVSGNQSKGLISNTNTGITNSYYDKTINAGMSDETDYGRTKSE
ncbi:MAG: filamentous hemagglutinin N-terminal domain-containing protein, partial [Campylobacterales bacterium]|nr:filamentous hemagglutinin N-terminal domain-containing protein [Campylobacterales bacterium]